MSRLSRWTLALFVFAAIPAGLAGSAAAQIQIFSTGQYGTPESISLAPAGFGTYGGNAYFIPDAHTGDIWFVPVTGGVGPTSFFKTVNLAPSGGLFLPSGWGDFSGQFLVEGLFVLDSSAKMTSIVPEGVLGLPTTPLIAPTGFGSYGGHLFVSDQSGTQSIWQTAPTLPGDIAHFQLFRDGTSFQALQIITAWGLEFTPPGWDPISGNRLLVSDGSVSVDSGPGARVSHIAALDPAGIDDRLFATIPLTDDPNPDLEQSGLRQMLMAPDGFFLPLGIPGQLLLVSVSGSGGGGGVLGELLALDHSGAVKAHLKVGSVLAKFDPRGMVFTGDGHLLISDTSDPIYKASALDFALGREDACRLAVTASLSTSSLWPPNHNLVNVGLTASATDTCAGSPSLSVEVFSDEDDQDASDGNFSPDAKDVAPGTLRLRSERKESGDGRVYLVVVKATDTLGYVAGTCDSVVVPHSQSKADQTSVESRATAATSFCRTRAFSAPAGYFKVGDGPVVGPKQ